MFLELFVQFYREQMEAEFQLTRIALTYFWATPHKCVVGLQPIFSAGNAPNFLDIHKVCLRKTAFFGVKSLAESSPPIYAVLPWIYFIEDARAVRRDVLGQKRAGNLSKDILLGAPLYGRRVLRCECSGHCKL